MAICNFSGTYGSAPRDCASLQSWLNTLIGDLVEVDQVRCSSGASDPTAADLNALWGACSPPSNGGVVVWTNTTTNEVQAWSLCSGTWSKVSLDLCDAMDLRVVPNGTPSSNFNSYWTADGCSGPPNTGALVVEDGTGNMWYWNGSAWTAISSGGGSIASTIYRYRGYSATTTITGVTSYPMPIFWFDNNDTSLGQTDTLTYTPQRTGRLRIEAFGDRDVVGTGDMGTMKIVIDGTTVVYQEQKDFQGGWSIYWWYDATAGTSFNLQIVDSKYPQDTRYTTVRAAYIIEF